MGEDGVLLNSYGNIEKGAEKQAMTEKDFINAAKPRSLSKIVVRAVICIVVILAGYVAMKTLGSLKKPPQAAEKKERAMEVAVEEARLNAVQVELKGYGVAEPVTSVRIASEVSGRIIYAHPQLKAGELIGPGDVLFKIDPADYESAVLMAEAQLQERKNALERLKADFKSDKKRRGTLLRSLELAEGEYARVKKLLEKSGIGNLSEVDRVEQAYNNAKDQADILDKSLLAYPISILEAEARIRSAKADVSRATTNLKRCTVEAPFGGRVNRVSMEAGEYVNPGGEILSFSDDTLLEIKVALDLKAAAAWLRFESDGGRGGGWFKRLLPSACMVYWTEAEEQSGWTGRLHRVVSLDRESRSLIVAVRVDGSGYESGDGQKKPLIPELNLPLAEGMFCLVSIPGKTIDNLIQVPRWSVTTDNTLYTAKNRRLKTKAVVVAYSNEAFHYIADGVEEGELIITTRLVDPMENALLSYTPAGLTEDSEAR